MESSTIYSNRFDHLTLLRVKVFKRFQLASDLWPVEDAAAKSNDSDENDDEGLSLEEQIQREVSSLKKPGPQKRFGSWLHRVWKLI